MSEEVSHDDVPDTHGPMFPPCSESSRSLARQLHVAAIPQRHFLRRSRHLAQLFLSIFELHVIAFSPSDLHRNLHMPLVGLPQWPSPRVLRDIFVGQLLRSPNGLRRTCEPTQRQRSFIASPSTQHLSNHCHPTFSKNVRQLCFAIIGGIPRPRASRVSPPPARPCARRGYRGGIGSISNFSPLR